ncbi:MAG: POTRA domain-containing protein [Gammaproteobacteria bacterium]
MRVDVGRLARHRTRFAVALIVAMTAFHPAAGEGPQEQAAACELPGETLEAQGARINSIEIDARNIFDLDDPAEDKALFRMMNRLNVRTRDQVIQRQLLFEQGDTFNRQQLYESERILRDTAYLYDAAVVVSACDDGMVDILVHTQDVWSLKPGISVSRSGGESRVGFDIQEDNFLGRGGSIGFLRRIDEERRRTELSYADRNLGGRWIALDTTIADNSDGHIFALGIERPFYALDTRWALGGTVRDERRRDPVYVLGDEIGRFRQDIEYFDMYGGRSRGLVDGWAHRWLGGLVYDERSFANAEDSLDPLLIPEHRRLVYPYIEYQLVEDRFERAKNLDQIDRTEDVSLGADMRVRLGVLAKPLGADRGGAVFSALGSRGYGDPNHMLWRFSAHADGRLESGELHNAIFGGAARWYLRQSERRLLFASLRGDVSRRLDLDNPLEIGGDDGLRGYPLRYQRGDARAQFTIEQRYFTDYYLWRLFRVGGAVFFDAGRVWGDNPFGGENLGLLKDVGFGLRLASTRSSIGRMIHVDFAFPLDGDSSISSFQFLVEGRRSF